MNPRILIVDDDADAGDALAVLFEMDGFDVTVARGSRAAFTVVESLAPAAVITDIRMPSLDGHALVRALRSFQTPAPRPLYVAFSGMEPTSHEAAEYRSAFDLWFTKPAGLASIVEEVRKSLGPGQLTQT